MATASAKTAERLKKERDAIQTKFDAVLKGHEQSVKMHGKHGQSLLSQAQHAHKRRVVVPTGLSKQAQSDLIKIQEGHRRMEQMAVESAEAVAFEKEWARKRARREEAEAQAKQTKR